MESLGDLSEPSCARARHIRKDSTSRQMVGPCRGRHTSSKHSVINVFGSFFRLTPGVLFLWSPPSQYTPMCLNARDPIHTRVFEDVPCSAMDFCHPVITVFAIQSLSSAIGTFQLSSFRPAQGHAGPCSATRALARKEGEPRSSSGHR